MHLALAALSVFLWLAQAACSSGEQGCRAFSKAESTLRVRQLAEMSDRAVTWTKELRFVSFGLYGHMDGLGVRAKI